MAADLLELDPRQVRPSPSQARQGFDDAEVGRLAESLRAHGMIQPIVVRRVSAMANLCRVPSIVRAAGDRACALEGLVKNMQRVDLDVFEEAEGYRRLTVEFGVSQAQVARLVGKSQSAVAKKLRLLRLGDEIRELARVGSRRAAPQGASARPRRDTRRTGPKGCRREGDRWPGGTGGRGHFPGRGSPSRAGRAHCAERRAGRRAAPAGWRRR